MSMKGKPNTAHFKLPKDPTIFLEGGEADKAEKMAVPSAMTPEPAASPSVVEEAPSNRRGRVHGRVQKIFNFPEYLADRLRDEARLRSHEKGSRVTEKDIVVEALEALLKDR